MSDITEPDEPDEGFDERDVEQADMSWMRQVREQRDERLKDEGLRIGVPSWGTEVDPDLVFEVRVIERRELDRYARQARRIERKRGNPSDLDIDFICRAVSAVWIRNPQTDRLVRMEQDGAPVRIDARLAAMLELDPSREGRDSHTLALYLFKNNGISLGTFAAKIARWMENTTAEVAGAILGE